MDKQIAMIVFLMVSSTIATTKDNEAPKAKEVNPLNEIKDGLMKPIDWFKNLRVWEPGADSSTSPSVDKIKDDIMKGMTWFLKALDIGASSTITKEAGSSITIKQDEMMKGIQRLLSPVTLGVDTYTELLSGKCPQKQVSTECIKLTNDGQQESNCCPPCDMLWPKAISAYQEVIKHPSRANMFLAAARSLQLATLGVAGAAGMVPILGDVAANPANAVVTGLDMILPEHASDDIKCMLEQFALMTDQMNQMEERIREHINSWKIAGHSQSFLTEYIAFRTKLENLRAQLQNYQDATANGNCENRETCEAFRGWLNHCNVTDPANHESPNQLFNELHTLVTGNFIGKSFLEAAAREDSSWKQLFGIYSSISSDITQLNMLNTKCNEEVKIEENLRQRLAFAKERVSKINEDLLGFLKRVINNEVNNDMEKLMMNTKEFKEWTDLEQALKNKVKTAHGDLLQQGLELARVEIAKEYPFFRTECAIYPLSVAPDQKEIFHHFLSTPPDYKPPQGSENMRISFKKTPPRIHLTDHREEGDMKATVCYTHIPEDTLESTVNYLEFWMCSMEYNTWRDKQTDSKLMEPENWQPQSPICERWKSLKDYFPAGRGKHDDNNSMLDG